MNALDGLREMIEKAVAEEVARRLPSEIAKALAESSSRSEFLTTKAVAAAAGVTLRTVRRWVAEGRLVALGDGRRLRFRRLDVEALLAGGRPGDRRLTPEQLADLDFH